MSVGDPHLPPDAIAAIDELSRTPRLLVASDFDGTMAAIVDVPSDATAVPETEAAMTELAGLPDTTVAVVSGRSLEVLRRLTALLANAHLVGSHGIEFDGSFAAGLTAAEQARLGAINHRADLIAARYPGIEIEKKPASTAIHYRHVAASERDAAVADIHAGPCDIDGVHLTIGKMVVEIAAVETGKGHALDRLREQDRATAVLFLGDDVTDENAFVRLHAPDVGVKVGEGDTAASIRIADTDAVARFLAALAERRLGWLRSR